ncbi:F0F1 ATP synthase subunit B [Fulvivirga sediminis]|uniref:ATP synthase subunit b n=1 Tax=Fulvivirga sediminis TaxID=2803949 RepID=A0A937FA10_9BACT|nr:F0F1 ATP synthase subunit B [Fulvivirga sediminis]MBL3657742.1 F0F1 ATP synthase subunit B [Fulvivirga sediminis]
MDQLINDFSPGLFIMQALIFLVLLFILAKFAWKPIIQSLKIREESIQDALDAAERAKQEMERLKSDNERLLDEARQEREQILKDARQVANSLKEEASLDAEKQAKRILEDARLAIKNEKQAALTEVKNQVAKLSLQITEKLLRRELADEKAQKELIEDFVKDTKLN